MNINKDCSTVVYRKLFCSQISLSAYINQSATFQKHFFKKCHDTDSRRGDRAAGKAVSQLWTHAYWHKPTSRRTHNCWTQKHTRFRLPLVILTHTTSSSHTPNTQRKLNELSNRTDGCHVNAAHRCHPVTVIPSWDLNILVVAPIGCAAPPLSTVHINWTITE